MTGGLECPICKTDTKTNNTDNTEDCFVSTKKGHVFHYTCLQSWVDQGKTQCPNCTESLGRNTVLRLIGIRERRVSLHQEALTAQVKADKNNKKALNPTFIDEPAAITAKIVALGEPGVGKSSLIKRFSNETFEDRYNATIGCDMNVKTIEVAGKLVDLHLWETAGQERFRSVVTNYVRNADGILLVYDVTNIATFKSIERWLEFANSHGPQEAIKILIGNKCENQKDRMVTKRRGKELADKLEIPFFETSARTGHNVELVFRTLGAEILLNPLTHEGDDVWGKSFSLTQAKSKEGSGSSKSSSKKCC